jgi:hypothetical protein
VATTSKPLGTLMALVASRPEDLLEHAQAYAALAHLEWQAAQGLWLKQVLLWVVVCGGALLSLSLAGTALMFSAVLPNTAPQAPHVLWLLVGVPLAPALLAVVAWLALQRLGKQASFGNLRRQWLADMSLLQEGRA